KCGAGQIVLILGAGGKRPQRRRIQAAAAEPLGIRRSVIEAVVVMAVTKEELVDHGWGGGVSQVDSVDVTGQEADVGAHTRSYDEGVILVVHIPTVAVVQVHFARNIGIEAKHGVSAVV